MKRKFFTRGFYEDNADAVLIYFSAGMRIVTGTTGAFIEKVLHADFDCPFVLQTDLGELAVGGVFRSTQPVFKKYAINAVLNCVKKIHDDGLRCSVTPVYAGINKQSLLLVCPVNPVVDEYEDEDEEDEVEEEDVAEEERIHNSEADYAKLETFVREWIDDFPGMYV